MDQGDAEDLMQLSRAQLGLCAKSKKRFPSKETLHYVYSRHINTGIAVDDILRDEYPQFVDYRDGLPARSSRDYIRRKAERNLVDYDDLLLFWATMLESAPQIADRIAAQYDHCWSTSTRIPTCCRREFFAACAGATATSRSSATTRRASTRSAARASGTSSISRASSRARRSSTLEQNYRSTQPILDATNTLISRAAERYTKNLWTQARWWRDSRGS